MKLASGRINAEAVAFGVERVEIDGTAGLPCSFRNLRLHLKIH